MFRRIYESFISPPEVPKGENPLRFGVLAASDIAFVLPHIPGVTKYNLMME
jgi:hypothetical protein